TLLTMAGFALGVTAMIALLSTGEAILQQAEDKSLLGGDLVLLPAGIDVEVLRVGGATGYDFTISNARFIQRQLLSGPRLGEKIAAVSPQMKNKVLYLRHRGTVRPVLVNGALPSQERIVNPTAPRIAAWRSNADDRAWMDPPPAVLYPTIDRFHLPNPLNPLAKTWAEWHYFKWHDDAQRAYGYLSFIIGGNLTTGRGRGVVMLRVSARGTHSPWYRHTAQVRLSDFSTTRPDLRIGQNTVRFDGARYRLCVAFTDAATKTPVRAVLSLRPTPDLYYPPFVVRAGGGFESGYVVPALHAEVDGEIVIGNRRLVLRRAHGYHDHNWGYWAAVHWDWGTASDGNYAVLYGAIHHPQLERAGLARNFLFLSQARRGARRGGLLGMFQPEAIEFERRKVLTLPRSKAVLHVPRTIRLRARADNGDTLHVVVDVQDVLPTPNAVPARPDLVFLQMRGNYRVSGRVANRRVDFRATGFAETFVNAKDESRTR
ncbi:MAG: ABC transporter permease, partial [Abditibacteriales bacterium]|nr:ABC transporter permease [Abditibacteriales bacterium]